MQHCIAKISKIDQQIIHNSASTQVREQNPKNDDQKKKKGTKKEGYDNDDIYHINIYILIYIYSMHCVREKKKC